MKLSALGGRTLVVRFTHKGTTELGTVTHVAHRRLRHGEPKARVACSDRVRLVRISCLEVIPQFTGARCTE